MTEQEKVQEWNRRHPVGTAVDVHREGGGVQASTTRCEARLLSGKSAVIWVRGMAGAYPLDRVSARVPDGAATPASIAERPGTAWVAPATMRFEVVGDPAIPDAWRVEAIDRNGTEQFFLAVFRGPAAEARAREYADWKNATRR